MIAVSQVFGRTVICRDLDVATKVAWTDGLDCITMEGQEGMLDEILSLYGSFCNVT